MLLVERMIGGKGTTTTQRCTFFTLCLVLLAIFTSSVQSIKFDVEASHNPHVKCIWNYALSDTLVIVTINTAVPSDIAKHDSDEQRIDVEVVDGSKHNNIYLSKKNIKSETRMAINTHSHADLGVCVKNTQKKGSNLKHLVTTIDLDVDIGADAVDYNAIANQESLSGLETEMRKLEAVAEEIVTEMDYLKKREEKMRDTNESTNQRVELTAWLTVLALIVLGAWQIFHLRSFFQKRYLIDS